MGLRSDFDSIPSRWALPFKVVGCLALVACATGQNSDATADAGIITAADARPVPPADAATCTAQYCYTGVACREGSDGLSCGPCPAGLEGDGMECTEIDGCSDAPCYAGVSCNDQPAPGVGFICGACPDGFLGNGIVCSDVDSCAGAPCFPDVACVDTPGPNGGYTCGTCPTGYEGDGLSCTDIDACSNAPCFEGVQCQDHLAPLTGYSCDGCPPGQIGDGETCELVCTAAAAITCGEVIAGNNGGPGSKDLVDNWACSLFALVGSETVYRFVPDASGIATAELSGLSADLDLLVVKEATTGVCDSSIDTLCIPGGASNGSGTVDEQVRWDAQAGQAYYLVVDGFSDANSDFNLRVRTSSSELLLNKIGYGFDDYIEVKNHGACTVDLEGLSLLHKASEEELALDYPIPNGSQVGPSQVLRFIESLSEPYASNEQNMGVQILDIPEAPGFTALCEGSCDLLNCTNLLDYVERDNDSEDAIGPQGPACASFAPGPLDAMGQSGEVALQRGGFSGSVGDHRASDWGFGASVRD